MKFQFISEHRSTFPVKKMCQLLGVSRSGLYAWSERPKSQRARNNEKLLSHIEDIFRNSRKTYGSPRIVHALKDLGISCSRNRVARLMRLNRIQAKS